jgi:hypothetical protein
VVAPTKGNIQQATAMYDAQFKHPLGNSYLEVEKNFDKSFDFGTIQDMHLYAFEMAYDYISGYMKPKKPIYENIEVNMKTGSGWPYCEQPYMKTKAEVPLWLVNDGIQCWDERTIWKISGKREKLPILDIEVGKIRTFAQPPFHYLLQQQIFSYNFNHDLINVPWCAYGFDYHYGGFNKLFSRIAKQLYITEWDVSCWDKRLPMKYDCALMRSRFLIMTQEEEACYWKMVEGEKEPFVLMPNGDVVQMFCGQVSGSANTTSDNTLAHIIIFFYALIKAAYEKDEIYPTLEFILANVEAAMYGDDNINGVSLYFNKYINNQKWISAVYADYNLLIKDDPSKFKTSLSVIGHTFLGLEVNFYSGKFVPFYSYEKVKNATCVLFEDIGLDMKISRFLALLDLLTFCPEYDQYVDFIRAYCGRLGIQPPFMRSQTNATRIQLGVD